MPVNMEESHKNCSGKQCHTDNTQNVLSSRQKPFASLIIFDTEATGFKRRPRITELCMIALLTDELKSTSRPRVFNKLQLCFNPQSAIEAQASRITGLYNDVLEQMPTFREHTPLISGFLTSLPQPACIIAHNGHRFDFPLLQSEFLKVNYTLPAEAEIYCADSLEVFRVLDGLPGVPEWVVQREKEERQRKALASGTTSSDSRDPTSSELGLKQSSSRGVTVRPSAPESIQDKERPSEDEPRTVSLNKRQMTCTDSGHEDLPSVCKLLKTEETPSFGSSLSDAELVEACDVAMAQMNAGNDAGPVSPVHVVADSSLQFIQETTPVRDPSWTNPGAGVAHRVMKKQPPLSYNIAERKRVARQLFDEKPDSVSDDDSLPKNRLKLGPSDTAQSSTAKLCQGSLPKEKQLQLVQLTETAVVSPPTTQSAAGEPLTPLQVRTKDDAANSMKNNPPVKSQVPETGMGPFSTSSAQNQVSEVSSSTIAAPPNSQPSSCQPASTPKVSYKLGEIYRRQFGQYPYVTHTAEDDCRSLLRIIENKALDVMLFVEDHAVRFDSVEPMY